MIFRFIHSLWKMSFTKYYRIKGQTYPPLIMHNNQKLKFRRRRYFYRIYIAIIVLFIIFSLFIIHLILSFPLHDKRKNINLKSDIIVSDRYVYIDIGCFDGETIEHFIYFNPNSSFYDIITFEPDPNNYQLCKQRLTQPKYSNLNIIFIQKVVWIRDEKVFFRINRGRKSRINLNVTAVSSDTKELDAIDFSSWLARLVKLNKTKVYIKMSAPGAEVEVLNKMVMDGTLPLADRYEVEWVDRENPYLRAPRIYIQMMFDTYGFTALYYTRLEEARTLFQINGTFDNITKHLDYRKLDPADLYAHYQQRPDVIEPTRKLNIGKKRIK